MACFISEIQQSEFPSFHSAWHQKWEYCLAEIKSLFLIEQFNLFKYWKVCLCARMQALEWKERAFIEKVNSGCFCWFPAAILVYQNCTSMASPYKALQNVLETFWQITQKLWATKTWDLEKLITYKSLITFHFLGFFQGRFPIYFLRWFIVC